MTELYPSMWLPYSVLGAIYYIDGDANKAIEEIKKGIELSGDSPLWMTILGINYSKAGDLSKVQNILDKFETKSKEEYVPYSLRAVLLAELGHNEEALEYLHIAYEEKESFLIYFRYIP